MKNLTTHKNWLREQITPPLLRRTGERVNRLQRDWSRDFGIQMLESEKAWRLYYNLKGKIHFQRWREKIRRKGNSVTMEMIL